uniref:Uncharacterized protein n=1 Tax=viral metagenome TaxID=1070528 RepID=A0A6C0ADE4_9ZZZZ
MIFLILNSLFSEIIISSFLVKIFVLESKHGTDNDSVIKENVCVVLKLF